jgi:putative hydrolase of the HAD superfamily
VTDGNKIVQHKKIIALGLENMVKKYFISYRHGLKHSKPSPYCFLKIAQLEKSDPDKIIYIGDNVNKDFVGIKPLGFKTLRVLTGQHSGISKEKEFEADYTINSLKELTPQLLNKIYGN